MDWSHRATNCNLKHIITGKVEGKRRRGGRCKQLLCDLKETRGYWNLKEEAQIALSGELSLESICTCRKTDFVINGWMKIFTIKISNIYFIWCLLDRASLRWLQNKKPARCHLLLLFFFSETQHVSGSNMPIFRLLRLCCWTTIMAVTFLVCCVLELGCGSAGVVSNTQQTKNVTASMVVQQHRRKRLKMGILMPETCWVSKKKNKSSKWHLVGFLFFSYLLKSLKYHKYIYIYIYIYIY